jgi:hypothetical protein
MKKRKKTKVASSSDYNDEDYNDEDYNDDDDDDDDDILFPVILKPIKRIPLTPPKVSSPPTPPFTVSPPPKVSNPATPPLKVSPTPTPIPPSPPPIPPPSPPISPPISPPSLPLQTIPIKKTELKPSVPLQKIPVQIQELKPSVPLQKIPVQIQELKPSVPLQKIPVQIQELIENLIENQIEKLLHYFYSIIEKKIDNLSEEEKFDTATFFYNQFLEKTFNDETSFDMSKVKESMNNLHFIIYVNDLINEDSNYANEKEKIHSILKTHISRYYEKPSVVNIDKTIEIYCEESEKLLKDKLKTKNNILQLKLSVVPLQQIPVHIKELQPKIPSSQISVRF